MLREQWLKEHNRKEVDVMSDDDGKEYIMEEPSLMDDGDEPENDALIKVYLPEKFLSEEEIDEAKSITQHND